MAENDPQEKPPVPFVYLDAKKPGNVTYLGKIEMPDHNVHALMVRGHSGSTHAFIAPPDLIENPLDAKQEMMAYVAAKKDLNNRQTPITFHLGLLNELIMGMRVVGQQRTVHAPDALHAISLPMGHFTVHERHVLRCPNAYQALGINRRPLFAPSAGPGG